MPRDLAVFDFDGTLTTCDTLRLFLNRCTSPNAVRVAAARHLPQMGMGAVFGREHRNRAKATMTRELLGGRSHDELIALAAEHAEHIVANLMRDDTVAWFRWHQARGHRTMIISASFAAYVKPVGDSLGADTVLATRWEVDSSGRLTGNLEGTNVRGEEKVRLLESSLGHPGIFIYGYGDSAGDAEMLERANIETWVRAARLPSPPIAA